MTSTAFRFPARALALIGLVALVLASTGCAFGEFRPTDPFDRQLSLDRAQHRYTVLVRFSDFARAGAFVAEEHREEFARRMKALDDARFTDYDSESVELDEEKEKATVRVTYTIYTPSLPYEVEVAEIQEWSRDGMGNNWRVVSTFEGLQQLVAN
ncbi:MAG: hypothetical protein NXI30_06360 [bacterium]|nr:hypothetical protein [bacterium]